MAKRERAALEMTARDIESGEPIKIMVEGESEMPFWNHDLKIRAAKALLESVDLKDFAEDDKLEQFEALMDDLQRTIDAVRGLN